MNNTQSFCNIESSFRQAMNDAGLVYAGEIVADGERHRFKADGDDNQNSWYTLHLDEPVCGNYGCWKRGINENWRAKTERKFTKEQNEAYRRRMKKIN